MSAPYIIVIQGGPASGKTTLARKIATDLNIGAIGKDDIKELLFDRIGLPATREESRDYGSVTMTMIFMIADKMASLGKSFILESAFHKELAESDLQELRSKYNVRLLQIYCYAEPQAQLNRYITRIKNNARHPGHLDKLDKTIESFIDYRTRYPELDIKPTIELETINFNQADYDRVLARIKSALVK